MKEGSDTGKEPKEGKKISFQNHVHLPVKVFHEEEIFLAKNRTQFEKEIIITPFGFSSILT